MLLLYRTIGAIAIHTNNPTNPIFSLLLFFALNEFPIGFRD